MVYLKNNSEVQEVYIPKMKHDADDVKTPYEIGYEDGRADQKNEDVSKLEDIFIDKNGTYVPNFGYKKVEVNCEGGPLEEKSVTIDGDVTEITPSEGFYGIGKAVIDATDYGNTKKKEQKEEDINNLETVNHRQYNEIMTVTPSEGHIGMKEVVVDATDLCKARAEDGMELQKRLDEEKLSSKEITENGEYKADYGFSSVTVNLPLEEKSVVLTATTQEIVPSSATPPTYKYVEVTEKARIIADYSYPQDCSFDIDYAYFFHDGLSGNYLKLLHVNDGFELFFIDKETLYYGYGTSAHYFLSDYSLVDGHLILDKRGVIVNDERIITLSDGAEMSAQAKLVFFGKEENGDDDAPVGTRLGTIKIYNSDGTLYDALSPCETSDGVGFHSELFDSYFYPIYGALKYMEEGSVETNYEGMTKVTVDSSIIASKAKVEQLAEDKSQIRHFGTIVENGDYFASDYNMLGFESVGVNVPQPSLQEEKTINITDNGAYTLTPDDTYEAIKKGTITVSINNGLNITDNNLVMYTSTDGKKVVPFFNAEIVKGVVTSSAFKSFEGQRLLFSNLYTETLKGLYIIDGELGYMVDMGFFGCSTLSSISFPDSLKEFGDTFEGCSSLSSITFGTGLEILQTELVFVIPSLKEITFKGATPPTITTHYTPSDIPTDVKLWVPKGALETYQTWLATTGFPSTWTIQEMQ